MKPKAVEKGLLVWNETSLGASLAQLRSQGGWSAGAFARHILIEFRDRETDFTEHWTQFTLADT